MRISPLRSPAPLVHYLASYGIDATLIPLDGWDYSGYKTVVIEPNTGARIYDPDTAALKTQWHDWPDDFDYGHFVKLYSKAWL